MVANNFNRQERILYQAKASWFSLISYLVIGLLIIWFGCSSGLIISYLSKIGITYIPHQFVTTLFSIIVFTGIFYIGNTILNILSTELILTNKRIIASSGFFNRQSIDIYISKLEGIEVKQSLLARVLNYGSIIVRGTGGSTTPIAFIFKPIDFKTNVNDFLSQITHWNSE